MNQLQTSGCGETGFLQHVVLRRVMKTPSIALSSPSAQRFDVCPTPFDASVQPVSPPVVPLIRVVLPEHRTSYNRTRSDQIMSSSMS